ncbi:tonsoku-like protein [Odontomachus brunneus]|uniref:tonsoku-like protein n=1 Tax=Odontomachus brunneus TaxID=486640 RepID=UPI0013F204E8|nr:tonsoku-like protein [Odontomachus brunneus]
MSIDKLIKRKQHAKRDNNLRQLAEITKTLGDIYFENEQPKKALQEYTEQLGICKDLGDKLSCAVANRMIGEVHVSLGDYEQALVHQNLHLEGARDMKNLIEEQRAHATLGRTYFCLAESLLNQSQRRDEALGNAKTAYVKSMELCDQLTSTDIKLEERTLMRARLLLNLGLTLEAQRETQQAIDLIEQATALCVSNNFQEDLHRTCISLAAIYERQGDFELALNYIETATMVNDTCLKAKAKLSKAELFMQSGQWIKTRKVLIALYTSSGLPKDINCQVEKYLRIIVTLCRAENSLLVENDARAKQKLYETMGDAAVAAQCFDKGVEYYRHMLTCAEETGEQVTVALTSLAQTLKDAGRCEEAVPLARRELELYANNPRERCQSALFLADLLTTTNATDTEIREHYTAALRSANESEDAKLRRSTAKEFVAYLESVGRLDEAEDTLRAMELATSEASSDAESEGNEESDQIGADICLEDLSDLEAEENVTTNAIRQRKREKRAPAIKRNEKGETQLHVACIDGDIGAVERLLSSGHPANVRDHCGWSPLHEAANHGHVEVAEALLKHGANVDDPGGASCKGITPLHDAASCGHFSVMQLLMQHGANLTLKTHDGDTVLDCLGDWRSRVTYLSPEDLVEYETMRNKLSAVITNSKRKKRKPENVQTLDRQSTKPEVQKISAGEDYKRTIASLRTFNKTNKVNVSGKSSDDVVSTPLVNEEQVLVDDWLEDDITVESIARRRSTSSRHVATSKRKFSNDNIEGTSKRRKRLNSIVESEEDLGDMSEDSSDSTVAEVIKVLEEPKRAERKRQVSLLSNGFTVSRSPSPIHDLQSPLHTSMSSRRYSKEQINLCVLVRDKMFDLKVDVCENEGDFLICIVNAIERVFFTETGCTAKLMLQPLNGSVATKESILNVARKNDAANRLECEVVELQVPPIVERYKTICCTHNVTPREIMLKCLRSCENTSLFRVKPDDMDEELLLAPLLKTLEYQKNIKLLQLSGIVLSTAGIHLRQCLANLSSLQELYLSGCNIDFACLREIITLPSQLRVLDLSYNPLSAGSCETLQKLISPLRYLQTLNLRYCELEEFCLPLDNPNLTSCDISWNKLSRDSVTSFLSKQLFELNLSNTLSSSSRFTSSLDTLNTVLSPSLESLELSFCDITDTDIKNILARLPRLLKLVLSGNKNITVSSVNMLLSRIPTLTYIDVSGCNSIVSSPEVGLVIENPEICTLLASVEPNLCDSWIKLWRGTGIVTRLPHNLTIFKPV